MKSAALEVAREVKDAVGEAIEQGVQSVAGSQPTPQSFDPAQDRQIQQKQLEDQKELHRVRKWFKDLEQQTAQVRQANQQKEQQRLQAQQQEKQVAIQKAQLQQVKKVPTPEAVLRSQVERKAGKGVGG